jgi:uncharacterized protein (TIGR02300 family)
MAAADMGTKRQCMACAARFYDLKKPKITCPKCGAAHDLDAATKARKTRRTTEVAVEPAPAPAAD